MITNLLNTLPPWALACAIVVACAVLNRVRGGGLGGQYLPGRALIWVAPLVGLLAWAVNPWPVAVAFGLGYLVWGLPGWGFTLSRLSGGYIPDREPDAFEALLAPLPALLAMAIRMAIVAPSIAAVAWLMNDWRFLLAIPVFVAATMAVYAVLFRPLGSHDWMRAELAAGACWGGLIVAPAFI